MFNKSLLAGCLITIAGALPDAVAEEAFLQYFGIGHYEEYGVDMTGKTNCFYRIETALPEP